MTPKKQQPKTEKPYDFFDAARDVCAALEKVGTDNYEHDIDRMYTVIRGYFGYGP